MAYFIDESAKVGNLRQITFLMDTDSDVSNLPKVGTAGTKQGDDEVSCLPCGVGSKALSIATGKLYILNSSNSWVEIGG